VDDKKPEQLPPRRVTRKAPAPLPHVGSSPTRIAAPKPTQMPLSWPLNYPSGLVLPSTVVIGKACAKFPVQTETLPFCKFIVSRLTPHFGAEVREGRMRAELALFLMEELLHYLLVYNCDSDSDRYRLEKDIKNSPDWLRLVRKVLAPAKSGRPPVQRNEQSTIRQRVDDYLARVTEKAGHKATRKDLWTVAGYTNRTEFERFQRDKKVTNSAKETFNRILEKMTPEQFLTALREKKLSKKKTSS